MTEGARSGAFRAKRFRKAVSPLRGVLKRGVCRSGGLFRCGGAVRTTVGQRVTISTRATTRRTPTTVRRRREKSCLGRIVARALSISCKVGILGGGRCVRTTVRLPARAFMGGKAFVCCRLCGGGERRVEGCVTVLDALPYCRRVVPAGLSGCVIG